MKATFLASGARKVAFLASGTVAAPSAVRAGTLAGWQRR